MSEHPAKEEATNRMATPGASSPLPEGAIARAGLHEMATGWPPTWISPREASACAANQSGARPEAQPIERSTVRGSAKSNGARPEDQPIRQSAARGSANRTERDQQLSKSDGARPEAQPIRQSAVRGSANRTERGQRLNQSDGARPEARPIKFARGRHTHLQVLGGLPGGKGEVSLGGVVRRMVPDRRLVAAVLQQEPPRGEHQRGDHFAQGGVAGNIGHADLQTTNYVQ
eukprot:1060206-Prorocentrum_minimum.AAC.1